jgi:hypothetical protein
MAEKMVVTLEDSIDELEGNLNFKLINDLKKISLPLN